MMRMKGIRSLRELTRILDVDRRVRRLCLIKKNENGYPRSVISRFTHRVGAETLQLIIEEKVILLLLRSRVVEADVLLDASFIKAFGKYLNVARTDFGSIQFTAPLPTMVMKRLRDMPQVRTIKVIKRNVDNPERRFKARIAKLYQMWISPDMKRSGVKQTHEDAFNAYLPDDFYGWYKPIRDYYAKMAKLMMGKEMGRMMKDVLGSNYHEAVEEADQLKGVDRLAEDAEKLVYRADDLAEEFMETLPK